MAADGIEQRAAEIILLYQEGLAVRLLERRFEISTWALYNLLRRHRVPLRGDVRPASASHRAAEAYERLRSDGLFHHEIAEKFGIKPNTLYRAVQQRRWQKPAIPPGAWR
ncbi:hypothetical protein ABT168_13385 [Streptomyces sp. NPDC001793]|uniref:hypothetical protein n=1 Tax=Streptomyces sp. NPDC001793 TaxID=3154657 RepID=UPI00331AD765